MKIIAAILLQLLFPIALFAQQVTVTGLVKRVNGEILPLANIRMLYDRAVSSSASEAANYPSNVVGGRGYFNLYIPDVRFFILE